MRRRPDPRDETSQDGAEWQYQSKPLGQERSEFGLPEQYFGDPKETRTRQPPKRIIEAGRY